MYCVLIYSGCQTQEKIVAANSKNFVVIADHSKGSDFLGQKVVSLNTTSKACCYEMLQVPYVVYARVCYNCLPHTLYDILCIHYLTQWKQGVPIEVLPFAYKPVKLTIEEKRGGKADLRMAKHKAVRNYSN